MPGQNLDAALELDLHFEILKSERYRALLLMGVFLLAICMFVLAAGVWAVTKPEGAAPVMGDALPVGRVAAGAVIMALVIILYELLVFIFLNRLLQRRTQMPGLFQYANTLIEISIPTLIIFYFSRTIDPVIAFNSPAVWIYFFFVILSVLRLSLAVSLFTGAAAAVQYLWLSLVFVTGPAAGVLEMYLRSPLPMVGRAVMLVAAGAVAGFVALELRKKITAAVNLSDERSRVVGIFGQYVSPAVVEKLLAQRIEPETRHVCVMFLDIRDFTRFSEEREPGEIITYLNALFSRFIEIVGRRNGIINKFLGDGFMAVFGAPVSDGRDVSNAVHAALEILDAVEEMNRAGLISPTRVGIGLHAGSAVTGNVGSDERKEYTIIGDTVNLASRIEQLNKEYGSCLLVTDTVYSVIPDLPGQALDPIEVRGRKSAVNLIRLR